MGITFRQGDTAEPISGFLENEDGSVINNLDQAVVDVYLQGEDGSMIIDGEQANIVDTSTGKIEYPVSEDEVDTPGDHDLWFEVRWSDGKKIVPTQDDVEFFIEET